MHAHARSLVLTAGALTALSLAPQAAAAQQISTRDQLVAMLAGPVRTETFDAPSQAGSVTALGAVATLDASTVFPGLGAGVIQPGIALANRNNGHWFFPSSYAWYGNPSGVYAASDRAFDLRFTSPTTAFGLDLWVFWSSPIPVTVSVYATDGALVATTTLPPSATQFFGWQHDAGISRVHFAGGTNDAASVRIDDLTFGVGAATVTPEPATATLVGVGLLALAASARRRARSGDVPTPS